MSAIGDFIGDIISDKPSLQMLTLFIIFIICVRYIYDKNKDKYVYISLIFLYLFSFMVLLINPNVFSLPVIYAMIIPVILNIVGMMLAYKANAIQSENEDGDIDKDDVFKVKSLIITCFVMISLVIVLGTLEFPTKIIYLLVSLLYIISSFIVYYANRSFTKNKRATG
jgi:hypothetical protein